MKLVLLSLLAFQSVGHATAGTGLIQAESGNMCWSVESNNKDGKIKPKSCNMNDSTQRFEWNGNNGNIRYGIYYVDGWAADPKVKLWNEGNSDQAKWYFDNTAGYSGLHTGQDSGKYCAFVQSGYIDTDECAKGEVNYSPFKFIDVTSPPTPAPTPRPTSSPTPNPTPSPTPSPTDAPRAPVIASSHGDPHFRTWDGLMFDFHGGCDLVLFKNSNYANGLGLEVHIRTKIDTWYSYIETAAVKLGDDILEITGGKKHISYWLNGVEVADMETSDVSLGDYAVRFKRIKEYQSQTRIELGNGSALSIESYKRFVRVNVKVANANQFAGTIGMLGSYPDGQHLARDKVTPIEDANEFGMEWQVLATESKLFHDESGAVQHPMKCLMPDSTQKSQRRLGETMIEEEEAALACARVPEHDRDSCIFDVMATQDKDMAGSY